MRILIVDSLHHSIHELLEENNLSYDYQPNISREEIIKLISDYDGLIIRSKTYIDEEVLQKANKLKFVARAGAGVDNINKKELDKRGITLIHAAEGNANALAEHTLGLILSIMNKIPSSYEEVKANQWKREYNRGYEISGKTIGVVGYGPMGMQVVKKFQCLDCEILIYDKEKKGYAPSYAKEVSIEELKEKADIVSFHIPLDDQNLNLIDYNYLAGFRKNIWLINAARGKILVAKDLIKHLEEGKVIAAGLDVWENEKISTMSEEEKNTFDKLCLMENVVLTPHVGGWSHESYFKINQVLVNKIISQFC